MFKATSFSNVKLQNVLNMINKKSLEKALAQLITSSDDVINMGPSITVQNRVSSQAVHRKNQINVLVSARNIESPSVASKQTARAEQMRHVQASGTGFICTMASKDTGEKVGMTKEMAITCLITPSLPGTTNMLKEMLLVDPIMIKLSDIFPSQIASRKLAKVFVNGSWIGVIDTPHLLCAKYRELRRTKEINIYITIVWDELLDEVHFWTDYGRLIRPLIIMDSNFNSVIEAEFQGSAEIPEFIQKPRLTKKHIEDLHSGTISFIDLIENGIMEYISPEEQLNCLIAEDIDNIVNDVTKPYTHVDIAQALFGLSTLVGILLDHNSPTRSTYETNQVKQTSGLYCLSWPWRLDKNGSLQVNCEHPIVRTIVNDFINPNGANATVAYIPRDGNMQEDSVILSKSSLDLGLFYVSYLNYNMTTIEAGEQIRLPGDDTMDVRSRASCAKLTPEGFLKSGTIINNGDVIIPKLMTIQATTGASRAGGGEQYKFIDRSIIYKNDEPARVEQLTRESITTSSDGKKFVYVKTISELPVSVGDKFSTRAGNKSIVADIVPSTDMPISASGRPITYLLNPQTFTSRMVVAQVLEGILANLAAQRGMFMDQSAYTKIDMRACQMELARYGFHNVCLEQVYCGRTGIAVDALIVVCPTYLQRLQKYAIKEGYSVQHGPKDELTGQPVSGGRASSGGSRHGEMEVGVISAHGSMGILKEIMYDNSDGIKLYICRKCGNRANVNIASQIFKCKLCGPLADIISVDSSKSSNLFMNYINTMSIGSTINLK
jgi:DNA-directed RNA polymerase beta subunit